MSKVITSTIVVVNGPQTTAGSNFIFLAKNGRIHAIIRETTIATNNLAATKPETTNLNEI